MNEKRKNLFNVILATLFLWAVTGALFWFALTRFNGIERIVLIVAGILAAFLTCVSTYILILAVFNKENRPLDMANYADFTGILTDITPISSINDDVYLTFEHDGGAIRVISGGAAFFNIGEEFKVGHIGEQLINLRPVRTRYMPSEYETIDFRGGIVTFSEEPGEDVLSVEYDSNYTIQVSHPDVYYITILKSENWDSYLKQYEAASMDDMLERLQEAIGAVCEMIPKPELLLMEYGDYRLEIDIERTRAFYSSSQRLVASCTCDGCRNYAAAAKLLPVESLQFFASIGVDIQKAAEIYAICKNPDGTLLYGGFYHLCGRILEGDSAWQPTEKNMKHLDEKKMFTLSERFKVSFQSDCSLLEEFFPAPAIQMEILENLPWVLDIENTYT